MCKKVFRVVCVLFIAIQILLAIDCFYCPLFSHTYDSSLFACESCEHENALKLPSLMNSLFILSKNCPARVCATPFGTILGYADGLPAFSNCNEKIVSSKYIHLNPYSSMYYTPQLANVPSYIPSKSKIWVSSNSLHDKDSLNEPNEVKDKQSWFKTGMAWQCVEFSRRYLLWTKGVVFSDVTGAYNIWNLSYVFKPISIKAIQENQSRISSSEFRRFPNNYSSVPPQHGDLLIYPIQSQMPFGHVSVIVGHEKKNDVDILYLAEQNFNSHSWLGKNYSRFVELRSVSAKDGKLVYEVVDEHFIIFGWMRAGT